MQEKSINHCSVGGIHVLKLLMNAAVDENLNIRLDTFSSFFILTLRPSVTSLRDIETFIEHALYWEFLENFIVHIVIQSTETPEWVIQVKPILYKISIGNFSRSESSY